MALAALILLAVAGLMAYIRFAPDDPARWHVVVPQGGAGGAQTYLMSAAPADMLARLALLVAETPRATVVAGSVQEGRITWVVRSAFWGFPDYVTAEIWQDGVIVWSRQRYGSNDWGVNALRLKDWVERLTAG